MNRLQDRSLRILVAEDNEINLRLIKEFLALRQFRCDAVADGSQVLEAVRSKEYDLIFIDLKMPRLNGVETIRRLRSLLKERCPKIVVITAYATPQEKATYIAECNPDGYLEKPFRSDQLFDMIGRLFPEASSKI